MTIRSAILPALIAIGLCLSGCLSFAQAASPGYEIKSFDSVVSVSKDATLFVAETIDVDFGANPRHGISRVISSAATIRGQRFTCHIKPGHITCDGVDVASSISNASDALNIKIGDAKKFLIGGHQYRIEYYVYNAVRLSQNRPEVYWNVTGNDWKMPVETVTCLLLPPDGQSTESVKMTSFIGVRHSTTRGSCELTEKGIRCSAQNLLPGEGLTLAAQLPVGSVSIPGLIEQWRWQLEAGLLLLGAGLAGVLGVWWMVPLFLIAFWMLVGRTENAGWDSSGSSSLDFGSSGDGFGGGGGDSW